jgi:predicted RNA binding protein YcfA (HicA-like mRNA interferase family)
MADGFYKTVSKILKGCGFSKIDGGKGSHEKWCRGSDGLTMIVPRNLKSRHTANAILKTIGVEDKL